MTDAAPDLALWLAALLAAGLAGDEAEAIRRGDRDAFRRFFQATHADLLRTLARRGLDAATAEDVAQKAYVWVWEHRDRIDPDRSLRGLLFRIGLTRGRNAVRDAGRRAAPTADEPTAGDPGDPAALADLRAALDAAVTDLPERRRQTFTLCFMDGLSHREAAEVMGVSPKTVEHQMGHALKAVRARLGPFLDGAEKNPPGG